jgi:predicted permease
LNAGSYPIRKIHALIDRSCAANVSTHFGFELSGSARSGVAVFAVGLVLAANPVRVSPGVLVGALARVSVQSALFFALLHLLHGVSLFAREALVCCSFSPATVVLLFAARYRAAEAESGSMLLISTLFAGGDRSSDDVVEQMMSKVISSWR